MSVCDWRYCQLEATTALRFGDGFYRHQARFPGKRSNGRLHRQSYCHYCKHHALQVDRWFVTCDVRPASEVERRGPYGRKAEAQQADR